VYNWEFTKKISAVATSSERIEKMLIDNEYVYKKGVINVLYLLVLGWLYCKHDKFTARREEFWLLVNPELKEHVQCCDVKRIILMMIDISIRVRLSKLMSSLV